MAIKPGLPNKKQTRLNPRDLKAKKNPKGGAQKKETDIHDAAMARGTNSAVDRLQ